MADFLLIHGSCHGAWCWRDTISELVAAGHRARAIDLPGHGEDDTPLEGQTLDACRDAIVGATTPGTILVGHSWGGYPISAAAEAAPDVIRGLIYLCAYVPLSGLSMVEMRKRAPRQPILQAVHRATDGRSYTIDPQQAPDLFYHDCPPKAVADAVPRLCPQATLPQTTPLTLTDRYAAVLRAYIRCAEDRTIPPEYQAEMTRDWPEGSVHVMQSSHSPFLADPAGLARLLSRISEGF